MERYLNGGENTKLPAEQEQQHLIKTYIKINNFFDHLK